MNRSSPSRGEDIPRKETSWDKGWRKRKMETLGGQIPKCVQDLSDPILAVIFYPLHGARI